MSRRLRHATAHREVVTELDWYRGIGTPISCSARRAACGACIRRNSRRTAMMSWHSMATLMTRSARCNVTSSFLRNDADNDTCGTAVPPTVQPAWEMLRLPGDTTVAGRVRIGQLIPIPVFSWFPDAVLGFYLEQGQQRGDSRSIPGSTSDGTSPPIRRSPQPCAPGRWSPALMPIAAAASCPGRRIGCSLALPAPECWT